MNSYSLLELNNYIKQVVALNFTDPIWVNCEISQVKESRGSVYLDFIQHDEESNEVVAQSSAAIWYKSYLFIRNKLGDLLPSILKEGSKVLVKVGVEYHERYGLKLVVVDIDPSFTIGQMEMARQKILERLKREELIEKNSYTYLPEVIQKVAVISSATAAGYKDFIHQINDNEYGYKIDVTLFSAAMQGSNTEKEVCAALDEILRLENDYDCVAIIRGGGAKLDLASFDNYNIGYKIATFPIPVLTGIGHEIDSTVADVVSYSPLKTPTAVAAFITDRILSFESEIVQAGIWINQIARQKVEQNKMMLEQIVNTLKMKPLEILSNASMKVDQQKALVYQAAKYSHKELTEHIYYIEKIIDIADPKKVLKRGYAIVKNRNDKVISKSTEIGINEIVSITFTNGNAEAKIEKIKNG